MYRRVSSHPRLEFGMLQVMIGLRLEHMCQQQDFRLTKELAGKAATNDSPFRSSTFQARITGLSVESAP